MGLILLADIQRRGQNPRMNRDAKRLNDPSVLPPSGYRRNHFHYELVGYVNCLVGCRISDNAEGAILFEERIKRFIADHPATPDTARYYEAVEDYVGAART